MNTNPQQPAQLVINDQAAQFLAAVEDAMRTPTSHRDDAPLPAIGPTPPVPQPGRPPMSQRATDISTIMLTGGAASLMVGGGASLVMLASGYADPAVCAIAFGAPTVLVLAIARLVGKAKAVAEAAPAPVHHHYNGNVTIDQRSLTTQTRGVIAHTRNQLPR
ncbi:hypothetical protein [Streptomyces sp. ML-6]|uniref:hypothetical protein n=1 Tax=Streptomyces sp. ML-6 TaxID=2982693 RepID=UPI0024BFEFC3|nr:hypothetical protein [Streptomyces sp. ML-6]MDK0524992.1 hypothetical protein [Streptomyces sp. ML-6]